MFLAAAVLPLFRATAEKPIMSRIGGLITGTWRVAIVAGGFVGIRRLCNRIARRLDTPVVRDVLSETWQQTRGNVHWYAASMVIHMLLFTVALLVLGNMHSPGTELPAGFLPVNDDLSLNHPLDRVEMAEAASLETSELNTDDLLHPQFKSQSGQHNDSSATFSEAGGGRENVVGTDGSGLGGFEVIAPGAGPMVRGAGGIGAGHGH